MAKKSNKKTTKNNSSSFVAGLSATTILFSVLLIGGAYHSEGFRKNPFENSTPETSEVSSSGGETSETPVDPEVSSGETSEDSGTTPESSETPVDPEVSEGETSENPGTNPDSSEEPEPLHYATMDGLMSEDYWTDGVKSNSYSDPNTMSGNFSCTIYATRDDKGIYLFIDQKVTNFMYSSSNWYSGLNVEFRFVTDNGLVNNPVEVALESENLTQFWASQWSGDTKHNFTDGYVTPIKNETEDVGITTLSKHILSFELFESYEDLGINPEDSIGFTYGRNPGGSSWASDADFGTEDISKSHLITTDGIVAPTATE